jgi:hypothetical protein
MDYPIPKHGRIELTADGDLVVRHDNGAILNTLYCGRDGLVITNEATIVQRDDPPKLRLATVGDQWRLATGIVSFNRCRRDGSGVQEELSWLRGSVIEDAQDGELGGQFDMYTRRRGEAEPSHALIVSDAYSERTGPRRTRFLMANPHDGLAEFA